MSRKNRTPEENARREKIRELLQMANIGSMEDIQSLFKETIAEFMENGLDAELDDKLGYSKYDYKNKDTDNSRNGHSSKTLRTSFGDVEVSVPRDRKSEFEPQVLKEKRHSIKCYAFLLANESATNNPLQKKTAVFKFASFGARGGT